MYTYRPILWIYLESKEYLRQVSEQIDYVQYMTFMRYW